MESDLTIFDVQNNFELRDEFISRYSNFILSSASKAVGRYIHKEDDEYSYALIAFNDAITKYDNTKGEFFKFAALLIRNKLIDEIRRQDNKVVPFSSLTTVNSKGEDEEFDVNINIEPINDTAIELHALKTQLMEYGISIFDIAKDSPKAKKTKKTASLVLRFISENDRARHSIIDLKELPVKLLMQQVSVNKKFLERHRRYIIAASIILNGDYPIISEYVKNIEEVR